VHSISRLFLSGAIVFILIGYNIAFSNLSNSQSISLTPQIGQVIDSTEKEFYHLFPDIKEFVEAEFRQISPAKFILIYKYKKAGIIYKRERTLSADAFELTRIHIELTDKYFTLQQQKQDSWITEPALLYKLGLKYLSRANYELSRQLLDDLVKEYPNDPMANLADSTSHQVNRIWKSNNVLFKRGSLLDHSGRTNLLIFSGYYGIWLGIATPIALKADSPQLFALGLILGAPLSVYTASTLSRDHSVSKAKATMISLGGHLGTWQGLGWGGLGDIEDNPTVIGIGEISGLAGIVSANYLSNRIEFTEGHASIMSSGLNWGLWYGFVFSAVVKDDNALQDMLIGSDIAVVSAGFLAKDSQASSSRIRLINLAGIVGTVAGLGVDLLFQVDNSEAAMAIVGAGGVAGLITGAKMTKDYDKDRGLAIFPLRSNLHSGYANCDRFSMEPEIILKRDNRQENHITPYLGLRMNF